MTKPEKNGRGSPSNSAIHKVQAILDRITMIGALLGVTVLTVAIIVVVGDIIWRRIGGGSFIGAVDLTQLSVVIAASMSIPYAFTKGAHVKIDLLAGIMSDRIKVLLDVMAALFGAALLAFLLWLTWGRAMEIWGYGDVSQDLAIPMILYWGALVVGLSLSVLACLLAAAKTLITRKTTDGD
ncbi:TRAP transporter small permease [Sulfitobacter sp. F26169L]|uniref:TRAP transporter small permease n=1 Tax=Sulfitobacter sp. F26169L TaxID=2996015 RepID=UPI0022609D8C|nr:TRAP transporter small permease [Sulfitobacter sp. F26169L]MCX7565981.1 TRAP transporter small permease [Sulfitobacter sp. F26169L]